MSCRQVDCFFYGLFMDAQLLIQAGAHPTNCRRACVPDFALVIGRRATLVPFPGARAYGMLIALAQAEIELLYGAPDLEGYREETLVAKTLEGELVRASCYILDRVPESCERNPEYALRLRGVLENLGFPEEYVASVG